MVTVKDMMIGFCLCGSIIGPPPIASKILLEALRLIASAPTTYFTQCLRHHGSFFVFPLYDDSPLISDRRRCEFYLIFILALLLLAVPEVFPHQENLGCQAKAEQAHSSLRENEDWQYHQVIDMRNSVCRENTAELVAFQNKQKTLRKLTRSYFRC
jgi:hypothetical protein